MLAYSETVIWNLEIGIITCSGKRLKLHFIAVRVAIKPIVITNYYCALSLAIWRDYYSEGVPRSAKQLEKYSRGARIPGNFSFVRPTSISSFQIFFFFAIRSLSLQGNMTAFSKDRYSIVWFSIRNGEIIEFWNFLNTSSWSLCCTRMLILVRQSIHIFFLIFRKLFLLASRHDSLNWTIDAWHLKVSRLHLDARCLSLFFFLWHTHTYTHFFPSYYVQHFFIIIIIQYRKIGLFPCRDNETIIFILYNLSDNEYDIL